MKLSIITINYNNLAGLRLTIESIVAQTWTDYEWIVIDGGSTDGSRELLEQYQDHFSYWCSERDGGVFNAMNKGIARAKGDMLNFMNSGDVYVGADTLSQVFGQEDKLADKPHVLYGDYYESFSDGHLKERIMPQHLDIHYLMYMPINHQSTFISRSLLADKGYDEGYAIIADWKAFLQWLMAGIPFVHIDTHVAKFDMGGINRQFEEKKLQELQQACDELIPEGVQLTAERLHTVIQYPTLERALSLFETNRTYFKVIARVVKTLYDLDYRLNKRNRR